MIVKRKSVRVQKSFSLKSDASKWAYRTQAQVEIGPYKRVQETERLADIQLKEILSTYYNKNKLYL